MSFHLKYDLRSLDNEAILAKIIPICQNPSNQLQLLTATLRHTPINLSAPLPNHRKPHRELFPSRVRSTLHSYSVYRVHGCLVIIFRLFHIKMQRVK